MLTKTVSAPIRIVGAQYAGSLDLVANLCVGEELELREEFNNAHDVHATEVYYQGHKLGYIERARAQEVRVLIAKGHIIRTLVSRNDPRNDLYNMLWCVVEHYKVLDPCDLLGPVLAMASKADNGKKHVWQTHAKGVSYTQYDATTRPPTVVEIRQTLADSVSKRF